MKKIFLILLSLLLGGCMFQFSGGLIGGEDCADLVELELGRDVESEDGASGFDLKGVYYSEKLDSCVSVWTSQVSDGVNQATVKYFDVEANTLIDEFVVEAGRVYEELKARDVLSDFADELRTLLNTEVEV
ncbi:hypothetical protein GF376_01155 [Candidatus Peregrinibacteria bacterium]|nr:hypothetical protein [Candidatus Peregrinibacteria bacterium]